MSNPDNPQDPFPDVKDPFIRQQLAMRDKYQGALQMVWRKPDNCPICDSTAWNLGDLIDAPLRAADVWRQSFSFQNEPRKVYVYAPVTCLYCGYTIFFHTGVLDVRLTEEIKAKPPLRMPGEPQ